MVVDYTGVGYRTNLVHNYCMVSNFFCKGLIFIVQLERRDGIIDEVFYYGRTINRSKSTVMIMAIMLLVKTKYFLTSFTVDKDLFPE